MRGSPSGRLPMGPLHRQRRSPAQGEIARPAGGVRDEFTHAAALAFTSDVCKFFAFPAVRFLTRSVEAGDRNSMLIYKHIRRQRIKSRMLNVVRAIRPLHTGADISDTIHRIRKT